jgi:hypothetical protein
MLERAKLAEPAKGCYIGKRTAKTGVQAGVKMTSIDNVDLPAQSEAV